MRTTKYTKHTKSQTHFGYFELLSVKDAHNRKNCRDWNGTEPWACCNCDCTKRLEERLRQHGEAFLPKLENANGPLNEFSKKRG